MLITFSPARDATMKTYKQLTYEYLKIIEYLIFNILIEAKYFCKAMITW